MFAALSFGAITVASPFISLPFSLQRARCEILRQASSVLGGRLGQDGGTILMASAVADNSNGTGAEESRVGPAVSSPPRITTFTRGYPPAHLMGGPSRSLSALVEGLAADFRFSVITSAFDDPAAGPMPSVQPGQWNSRGQAMIWYEHRYRISTWRTAALLKETRAGTRLPEQLLRLSLHDPPHAHRTDDVEQDSCRASATR